MARCQFLLTLLLFASLGEMPCQAQGFGEPPQPVLIRPAPVPFGAPAPRGDKVPAPAVSLFEPVDMPAESAAPVAPPENLAPRATTASLPMKYFAPGRKEKESLDVLRQKYTEIMLRRAEMMTAEELASGIEQTQQMLDERLAREALGNVEDALRRIAEDFPGTSAGADARRALGALLHSAAPAATNTAEIPPVRVQR